MRAVVMLPMAQTEPMFYNSGSQIVAGGNIQNTALSSPLTSESDVDDLVDIFFDVDVTLNDQPG